ncbi:MAG: DUF3656 domain-containing U32 family peptidase [Bacteroidales bacterium]
MKKIELLSPAKNLDVGMAAFQHGADAVYIGGPLFSAREDAMNSISDIEKLAKFGHKFNAKTYLALNTLLYDNEVDDAIKIAHEAYNAGVDAIIIQDLGLIEAGLPPIPIHASTQMHNDSLEKVKFLENVGFSRVVLPREFSLSEIENISQNSDIEIEFFVHGALCVSYSGQCYLSAERGRRSANRGACAQPCRLAWNVLDKSKQFLLENSHILSLKDFRLDYELKNLLKAGVMSLKIEGRLKNISYVKNIVAHYRQVLDKLLDNREFGKASSGKVYFDFTPDPEKSFNRQFTQLNINGIIADIANTAGPKSMGKFLGKTIENRDNYLIINTKEKAIAGDGICWIDKSGNIIGSEIYKVEGNKIYARRIETCMPGTEVFRNKDLNFENELNRNKTERLIDVEIGVKFGKQIALSATDEDKNRVEIILENSFDEALNAEKAISTIKEQFSKAGGTIFSINNVKIEGDEIAFIRISELNSIRRNLLQQLEDKRLENYKREYGGKISYPQYIDKEILHYHNVLNNYAKTFYEKCGSQVVEMAPEFEHNYENVALMTTHHCIKYSLGRCTIKYNPKPLILAPSDPEFISDGENTYKLSYDCKNCRMKIFKYE